MVMARRPSGDWATPARLDALSHGAIRPPFHPSTESCQALPSPKGDYFLTEWAFFPRRAWSESFGPEVRLCPSLGCRKWGPERETGADWLKPWPGEPLGARPAMVRSRRAEGGAGIGLRDWCDPCPGAMG